MRLIAAVVAALVLAGIASAGVQPRVKRVPWDARTHGAARFHSDGNVIWIRSATLLGPNVWRLDPKASAPKRTPLPNLWDIVAGDGQLWAIKRSGRRVRVYYVDIRARYRLVEKRVPPGCGGTETGHLVFRGRLWFHCDFQRYAVFTPRQAAPAPAQRPGGRR